MIGLTLPHSEFLSIFIGRGAVDRAQNDRVARVVIFIPVSACLKKTKGIIDLKKTQPNKQY